MNKIGNKIILLLTFLLLTANMRSETKDVEKDKLVYASTIEALKVDADLPVDQLMIKVALYFKNKPYVASTLDNNENEQLVVNFREFDCTTFVETCIALTRTLKSGDTSFDNYCKQLQNLRYRNGIIEDYTSRLHYVSDWIVENSEQGILVDETKALGGFLETKRIDFMSNHFSAYKPLKTNKDLQQKIVEIETHIASKEGFYVLSKDMISKVATKIKDGDIIAFATSIAGLDYSHIGIAFHDKGKLTFIHASTRTNSVVIEAKSLVDYCKNSAKCTGISVFRLNDIL